MADEQQAKPSFKHTIAKKALAPVVATVATAVTSYLLRKGAELWQEQVQPKIDERGGPQAVLREVSDKAGGDAAAEASPEPQAEQVSEDDRDDERKKREQRRKQRRRALEQTGSS